MTPTSQYLDATRTWVSTVCCCLTSWANCYSWDSNYSSHCCLITMLSSYLYVYKFGWVFLLLCQPILHSPWFGS
jgi:hypothetical protein